MPAESGGEPSPPAPQSAPEGWRCIDSAGTASNVFQVDPMRPDYPERWRADQERDDRKILARDRSVQDAVRELRAYYSRYDLERMTEVITMGAEIRTAVGDETLILNSHLLLQGIRQNIRTTAERVAPSGVSYVTTIRYLAEQVLPIELVLYVSDEIPVPVDVIVNAESDRKLLLSLMPGQTLLRFRGIARRDLNRIGRFITEALEIADPNQRRNRGGRPSVQDEPSQAATAELVAKLSRWEGWSHRRIAAFLGWLGPEDDWSDPKVRLRTEQRVRRWVRQGEGALAIGSTDDDKQGWKQRPAHLTQAVQAEERRAGRR